MTDIRIYMEGGGDSAEGKAALRRGMDTFLKSLKDLVSRRRWGWRLVPCGGRRETYEAVLEAERRGDAIVVLLVDSEAPVKGSPKEHLERQDRWDLDALPDERIHLMAQTMETWIVADPDMLQKYYGQGFRINSLPVRSNLEEESKADVAARLKQATRETKTKGEYHKIRHGGELLSKIRPGEVRKRCPHCERLFQQLEKLLE